RRPGQRARARDRRPDRRARLPLQPQRGEAGGHRRRDRRQSAGADHGGAVAVPRADTPTRRRPRRAPPPRVPSRPGRAPGRARRRRIRSRRPRAGDRRCPGEGGTAMIGSVRGEVLERSATGEVLVEVGGVGYRTLVPLSAIPKLEPGAPTMLFTHLHVPDDPMVLFGFPSRDERDTFEVLIGANGVGPKLALAILSGHSPG